MMHSVLVMMMYQKNSKKNEGAVLTTVTTPLPRGIKHMTIVTHSHDGASEDMSHLAMNAWPNPPWNTVTYEWNVTYEESTPQWYAQHLAKNALRINLQYSTHDFAKEQIAAMATYYASTHEQVTHEQVTHEQERQGIDTSNGVVTDTHIFFKTQEGRLIKKALPTTPEHVGNLLQLCLDYALTSVWVLAGTTLSERATHEFIDGASAYGWVVKHAQFTDARAMDTQRCTFLQAWKSKDARVTNEKGRVLSIGYAEHNADWNLDNVTSPVTVLAVLAYIEDGLGIPVTYSAGNTGKLLMKKVNSSPRDNWIRPVDLHEIVPLVETKVQDITWKRPLTEEESASGYLLVAYDKNMMYPASCTSVLLGSGMPTHVTRPTFDMKKLQAGIWHITISGTSQFDGVMLPHPTDGVTSGWFYSYTVKLLHELGYTVNIIEAWVWDVKETHTTLRPYAEKLWEARASLDDKLTPDTQRYVHAQARAIAASDIKYIAVKSLGWLDMSPRYSTSGAYDMYRPDWYNLIKDNARYQMFWRIRKYMEKGYMPVGIHADCLYYLATTHDHEQALPLMMERKDKLGGYKQKYKTTISHEQVTPLLNDTSLDMSQVNQKLLAIDKKQVASSLEQ